MRPAVLAVVAVALAALILMFSARPAGQHGAPVTPMTISPAVTWQP